MEAALFGLFDFVAKHKWVQYLLIALAVIATLGLYLAMRDEGVKRRERERWLRKQAEERARTIETVNRVGQETENAKDRALEAPRNVSDVASADELRDRYPDNAAVILRPRGAGGS